MKKKIPVVLHQLSNFSSGLGNSIVMITIPWLILEETSSPAFAGLAAQGATGNAGETLASKKDVLMAVLKSLDMK